MRYHYHFEKVSSLRFTNRFSTFIIALVFVSMVFAQKASALTTSQCNIAWNPDSGSVAGYDVYWGTSSGNYTNSSNVGNVTTATLQNLSSTAYYIAVTAYNSSGNQGAYSPELVIYPLTSSAGTGGSISPAGSFFQSNGASQTFTITPAAGYQVANVTVDGVSVGAVTTFTLSNITAGHSVSATFGAQAATTCTVTASAGSNGSISPSGSVLVSSGSTQKFTVTPNTGYTASMGGTCGGSLIGNTFTTNPITANCTVVASFSQSPSQSSSISRLQGTYNSSAGLIPSLAYPNNVSANSLLLVSVTWGNVSTTPTVTDSLGNSFNLVRSVFDSPTTQGWCLYYAINTKGAGADTINVSYASGSNYGGLIIDEFSGVSTSSPLDSSAIQDQANITGGTNALSSGSFSTSSAGDLIYASTCNLNNNITSLASGTNFNSGTTVSSFWGFTGSFAGTEYLTQSSPGSIAGTFTTNNTTGLYGITIAAAFKPSGGAATTYTITASAGSNGTISPSGSVSASSGSTQKFTVTPSSGYTASVGGTCGGTLSGNTYTTNPITANCTVTASFATSSYTITASAGTGGTISPSGTVTVSSRANQTFTVTPNSGYSVSSVVVDGKSVGAVTIYSFSSVAANHTISATFSQNAATTYTITASAGTGGTISPSGTMTVSHGASKTFSITPSTGYNVASVLVDGASFGAVTSYTLSNITANHTISASFVAAATFTITASTGPNGSISPSGAVSVKSGASQTFTITPVSGYKIACVDVDGVSAGVVTSYSFSNVTANHNITASFVTSNPLPVADAGPNQTVAAGTHVTLSGLNSTDSSGPGIASYKWTQTGGTLVWLFSSSSSMPSFIAPIKQGALTFQLTVTDRNGLQATATCNVNVVTSSADMPPTANAGPDQTVSEYTIVTLDGSKSTASSGDICSYLWQQIDGPSVSLSNSTSSQATFAAPQDPTGNVSLSFILTVTDSYGFKSTDICFVNVTWTGSAPKAVAGSSQTQSAGSVVTLSGSNSTASNGIASFLWHQAGGFPETLPSPNTANPTFTAQNGGTYGSTQTFWVIVQDSAGLRSKAAEVVTVH
jgi:hypothetical protein